MSSSSGEIRLAVSSGHERDGICWWCGVKREGSTGVAGCLGSGRGPVCYKEQIREQQIVVMSIVA